MRFYRVENLERNVVFINPFHVVSIERCEDEESFTIISTSLDRHYCVNKELPAVREDIERCLNGN